MDVMIVFAFSREQALKDGVLKDATRLAREIGFSVPVALTAACWERCVAVPPSVSSQDVEGRLWDVLNVLRFTAPRKPTESQINFAVEVRNQEERSERVQLKALIGPGDMGEPVLTIMLPYED